MLEITATVHLNFRTIATVALAAMAALRTVGRRISEKLPTDVVILSAVRSPVTRAFKGGFKDAYPEDIIGPVGPLVAYLKTLQTYFETLIGHVRSCETCEYSNARCE